MTHISTTVYSQVLIYTAESTVSDVNGENENAQSSKRYQRGIRTRAHTIASPAFNHWVTALQCPIVLILHAKCFRYSNANHMLVGSFIPRYIGAFSCINESSPAFLFTLSSFSSSSSSSSSSSLSFLVTWRHWKSFEYLYSTLSCLLSSTSSTSFNPTLSYLF